MFVLAGKNKMLFRNRYILSIGWVNSFQIDLGKIFTPTLVYSRRSLKNFTRKRKNRTFIFKKT